VVIATAQQGFAGRSASAGKATSAVSCLGQPIAQGRHSWLCPLLGVTKDAYRDGDAPEFAAIAAVAEHHNALAATLREARDQFTPRFGRSETGTVDVGPWCRGFYAAIQSNPKYWRKLLPARRRRPAREAHSLGPLTTASSTFAGALSPRPAHNGYCTPPRQSRRARAPLPGAPPATVTFNSRLRSLFWKPLAARGFDPAMERYSVSL
jgi:Uncharacterised protein family (UPF0149)